MYLTILLASISIPFLFHITRPITSTIKQASTAQSTSAAAMSNSQSTSRSSRMPVYFLGIGGPNFMESTDHPAYSKLESIGLDITTNVKPKAVVVFSAHWQAGATKVQINVAESPDLIYDFYNFPPHYYAYKYPNKGSPQVAEKVIRKLTAAGIEVERVDRGLDHGVWVGFMAAFNPERNPLKVPIVQVSLFNNENVDLHYRMGQALKGLRDEGILIIGAGMAAHNLQDFRLMRARGSSVQTMPYVVSFDQALKEAATAKPEERQKKMLDLMKRSDARKAHPTLDHVLPAYVAAGAAGSDVGEQLWTFPEGSLSWAQFAWGRNCA